MKNELRVQKKYCWIFGINLNQIDFYITDYADVWIRDYGSMFLVNESKSLAWVKTKYNGYGKADDPYFSPLLKIIIFLMTNFTNYSKI